MEMSRVGIGEISSQTRELVGFQDQGLVGLSSGIDGFLSSGLVGLSSGMRSEIGGFGQVFKPGSGLGPFTLQELQAVVSCLMWTLGTKL